MKEGQDKIYYVTADSFGAASHSPHLEVFRNIGLDSIEPILFEGREIVPIQFLKALLPDPGSLGPLTKGKTCIGVIARGIKDGMLVSLASRKGDIALHAKITTRVKPGVVYTTFHNPETGANVVTTEYGDWATDCPEYKVTAVQVAPATHRSAWQEGHDERAHRDALERLAAGADDTICHRITYP